MEKTCYGFKSIDKVDIQPTRVLILMSALANLSLNDFVDPDCRLCIINEENNNLHKVILGKFVTDVTSLISNIDCNDKAALGINDLINIVLTAPYTYICPEVLFADLATILSEDVDIVKSDKINEILNFGVNALFKAINLNLEAYNSDEELEELNENTWQLATDIISKIKENNEQY